MNIEIKRLSPELTNDYIEFFDNIAFADNEEWAGCYCVWYHWNDSLELEREVYTASGGTCFKRELAIKYIRDNILQGYLAYVDGTVVGWCNTSDKVNYDGLCKEKCPELWEETDDANRVKSIVCYTIAPHMRRMGIASQLLKKVCLDASAEGFSCVEAYPGKGTSNVHRNYHGPYALYEKFGFTTYKDLGDAAIVRKDS